MKTRNLVLLLIVVMAMVLSSCGGGAPAAPAAPAAAPQAAPAAPAAAEGAELSGDIVYWGMWNEGEPMQQALTEIFAAFEKAHPKVKVQVTWAGREVLTKSRSAILAGQQLDLVDQAADELNAALMKNDQVLPLDDLLVENAYGEDVKFGDIFVPNVLDPYKSNGKVVFIPHTMISSGFWYDEGLLKANNIAVPKTWDELMAACETLKGKSIPCFAQDGTVDFYNAYWFYWLAERVMGPGAFYKAVTDPTGASWDDPGWLKVAQLVQQPTKQGYMMKGFEGSVWPAGQVSWSQGQAAFVLCGSWIPTETSKTAKPDFKYRGFLFPEVAGGKGKTTDVKSYLMGWVMPKASKNQAATRELIKFTLTAENAAKMTSMYQALSPRKGVATPALLPDVKDWFANAKTLFKPYDGVQADNPAWWTTIFMPLDNKLLFGTVTPEDFMKTLKASTTDYWSKPTPTPAAVR